MRIEEEHPDVLQNIEFAVVSFSRKRSDMTDHNVLRAYEAVLDFYAAEHTGRAPRPVDLNELEKRLVVAVKDMCELRLGRGQMRTEEDGEFEMPTVDVPTLVLCLKRLCKSVKTWTRRSGRQGYLSFVRQFVM